VGVVLALLGGFGFGLSLIVAIGAQNAFVLRQGLRGEHVGLVVATCALSDAMLIAAGVAGAGALLARAPALADAARAGGALFLLAYAALAARRALRPGALTPAAADARRPGRGATLATTLALTWLNPHVYLDTVLLLGSVARTHGGGVAFGFGACVASLLWFPGLGYGARLLRPLFARPAAWRVLDAVIAVVMLTLAITLLHGL
jgi:L-lysine exporter family protein LysE/ArgO